MKRYYYAGLNKFMQHNKGKWVLYKDVEEKINEYEFRIKLLEALNKM